MTNKQAIQIVRDAFDAIDVLENDGTILAWYLGLETDFEGSSVPAFAADYEVAGIEGFEEAFDILREKIVTIYQHSQDNRDGAKLLKNKARQIMGEDDGKLFVVKQGEDVVIMVCYDPEFECLIKKGRR